MTTHITTVINPLKHVYFTPDPYILKLYPGSLYIEIIPRILIYWNHTPDTYILKLYPGYLYIEIIPRILIHWNYTPDTYTLKLYPGCIEVVFDTIAALEHADSINYDLLAVLVKTICNDTMTSAKGAILIFLPGTFKLEI